MDTHKKAVDLQLELEALGRVLKAKLPSPFRRDPFHTRRRKFPRGTSHPLRRFNAVMTRELVNAQQGLEAALRGAGLTWRSLEKVIHGKYRGKWSMVELAAKSLLSSEAKTQGAT